MILLSVIIIHFTLITSLLRIEEYIKHQHAYLLNLFISNNRIGNIKTSSITMLCTAIEQGKQFNINLINLPIIFDYLIRITEHIVSVLHILQCHYLY